MVEDIEIAPKINDDEIIWRYMDFASFCYLLQTNQLFFRRLDHYTDAFEGTLPEEARQNLITYLSNMPWNNNSKAIDLANQFMFHLSELNKGTLSNSWVCSRKEIYAMWKIYLRGSQEGIAIRTTVGKLRANLNDNSDSFTLAKINYNVIPWLNTDYRTLATLKSPEYAYECELRALMFNQFTPETKSKDVFPKVALFDKGYMCLINPHSLIEEIYISPFAGNWFYGVVKSLVEIYLPLFGIEKIIFSRIKDKRIAMCQFG